MTKKQAEAFTYWLDRMARLGFSQDDAEALRRIEMTLHRWHEQECGDSNEYNSWAIERDENGEGPPYMVTHPNVGKTRRELIPDREKGAWRRLAVIMERYPKFISFIQTDPRGGSLYVVPRKDVGQDGTSGAIDCVYSSRGTYCNWG